MGQGLGKIQKRILTVLKTIEERYIEKASRERRWIWLNILIIKVYHPQQLEGEKRGWDWGYSKNEHRRIWESVKELERRGLTETRIVEAKALGLKVRFGGCTRWMEVRKITEEERIEESPSIQHPDNVPYYPIRKSEV